MKKLFKNKELLKYIALPLGLGTIVGIISNLLTTKDYISPSFAPPDFVFPIVWTVLYILMGISAYLIAKSGDINSKCALKIYYIQLTFNLLWSIAFFNLNLYLFSFIWLLILITLVVIMIIKFYKINKSAAYLQIPYLLWIIFASILNYYIYLLN